MPNDDTHDVAPKAAPLTWLSKLNHGFNIVTGLSAFTVLSSLAVGYFQYLNSYEEKVRSQAKDDLVAAMAPPVRRRKAQQTHMRMKCSP